MNYQAALDQTTPDGLRLFTHRWAPEPSARAVLVLVHGLIEHAGRYADVADRLVGRGIAVVAQDLRGHGRSQGPRVYVDSFRLWVDDLDRFIERIKEDFSGLPLFVFGQSMGGAIASRWAIERNPPIAGLILSAPAIRIGHGALPWFAPLGIVGNSLFPRLRLIRLGVSGLSRDPDRRAEFLADPLVCHERFPVRTGIEIIRAGRWIRRRAARLRPPLLAMHGTADRATDPRGTERLVDGAQTPDKTFIAYPGFYHDLMHDVGSEQTQGDMTAWIEARITGAAPSRVEE